MFGSRINLNCKVSVSHYAYINNLANSYQFNYDGGNKQHISSGSDSEHITRMNEVKGWENNNVNTRERGNNIFAHPHHMLFVSVYILK